MGEYSEPEEEIKKQEQLGEINASQIRDTQKQNYLEREQNKGDKSEKTNKECYYRDVEGFLNNECIGCEPNEDP